MRTASSKVVTSDELLTRLAPARVPRPRVALVTGGFALLHGAVARHLAEVRHGADVVVAVVLDDPDAAFAPAFDRALVVAALRSVDYVLVATPDGLPELRRRLQPDVDVPSPEDATRLLLERLRQ